MKTVFLFVPQYVFSSDFLRTEYIKYLASKFRVIAFVPAALLAGNKPYYQSPNLIYVVKDLESFKFWNFFDKFLRYNLIRKYDFEPVIQRNRAIGMRNIWKRLFRFLAYFFPKNLITPHLFTWLEIRLAPQSKIFLEYVKKYQPVLAIMPTPGFNYFDAEAVILAKRAKLPTVAVDFSWDNLHNGGIKFRRVDYFIVWNDIIKNTAVKEYGYQADKVFVSGVMRFDHYFKKMPRELSREDFLKSKGLDPKEKVILLTTVTKGNYADEHLLLEDLLKARDEGRFQGCPNIFVRLHPKEEVEKFAKFMGGGIKNLHVEEAGTKREVALGMGIELDENDLLNLKHTLIYADVEINYLSTITLEAFAFDKPVINIDFPEKYHRGYAFRHYKPIIDMKAVGIASSFQELLELVNRYLANPELGREKRQEATRKFIQFTDGFSYKRSVDFLEHIIAIGEQRGK